MNLRTLCAVAALFTGINAAGFVEYYSHRDVAHGAIAAESLDEAKAMLDQYHSNDLSVVRACLQEELGLWVVEHGSRDTMQEKIDSNRSKKFWLGMVPTAVGFVGAYACLAGTLINGTEWYSHTQGNQNNRLGSVSTEAFGPALVFVESAWRDEYYMKGAASASKKCAYSAAAFGAGVVVFAVGNEIANLYRTAQQACEKNLAAFDRIKALLEYLG